MKTNKHIITTSMQQSLLTLPQTFETSRNLSVSLVFPPVYLVKQETQTNVEIPPIKVKSSKQSKESVDPYVQICLKLINKQDQLIQHKTISEFDSYLKSNSNIKQICIHTIQISKTGKLQTGKVDTIINTGKNIGKSSETTIFQQAIQEVTKKYLMHINKKIEVYPHFMLLDLYKYHKGELSNQSNDLTLKKDEKNLFIVDQIDNKIDYDSSLVFPQYIQRKYDGLRCGAFTNITITPEMYNQQGLRFAESHITLLSRGHKEFNTLDTLKLNIQQLFNMLITPSYIQKLQSILQSNVYQMGSISGFQNTTNNINTQPSNDINVGLTAPKLIDTQMSIFPHNLLLDGELYIHNKPLQTLNSIIRNASQPKDKEDIQLVIYDIDLTTNNRALQVQIPFHLRIQVMHVIEAAIQQLTIKNIKIAPTCTVNSQNELVSLFSSFIKDKYEGAVIRDPNSLYCYSINNKRSKDSLKYKLKLDMEVWVCNYLDGQGKDAGSVIYECKIDKQSQESFQVVQNTTYLNRQKMFNLLTSNPQYINIIRQIPLNIEYAVLSESGLPQQPRGIYFRTDDLDIDIPKDMIDLM